MEEEKKEKLDLYIGLVINGKYEIQKRLGKGGFGDVYLVQDINDGKKYALKIMLENKNSKENKNRFKNEIEILKGLYELNPSYILKLYDEGEFITKNKVERLYFVVDYAEKGDLCPYICINGGLGEYYGKILFKKILEGIQFCHSYNVCHLDIKIPNILLDEKFNPIIIDFGLSKSISDNGKLKYYSGKNGTQPNMCPQMLEEGKTYNGIDADIFSLGTLLFCLVLGKNYTSELKDAYNYIKAKNYDLFWETITQKDELSNEFKNLFVKMVAYNPEERPRIEKILSDEPWLKELNTLIKNNPEEYKKLEEEYINYMEKIENKIKAAQQIETKTQKENKIEEEEKKKTKGILFDKIEKYFIDLKPKKIKDKRNYKYYLEIIGDINPNDFMNILVNEIKNNYGSKCLINTDSEKLKFITTFINEDDSEEEDDEDNRKNCSMKIKIYNDGINEYLLCFEKNQGDSMIFYENFLKIKDIIQNIFN